MAERLAQEFYCNDCDGWIRFKVNMSINRRIFVVCPNCGRQHPRVIEDGKVLENGTKKLTGEPQEIIPPKSAYSKFSVSKKMQDAKNTQPRNGIPLTEEDMRDPRLDEIIKARYLELYGDKV